MYHTTVFLDHMHMISPEGIGNNMVTSVAKSSMNNFCNMNCITVLANILTGTIAANIILTIISVQMYINNVISMYCTAVFPEIISIQFLLNDIVNYMVTGNCHGSISTWQ
jgi:hypothetical protein